MTKKKIIITLFLVIVLLVFLPGLIKHFKMYLELREINDPVIYSQYSDQYVFRVFDRVCSEEQCSIFILQPYIGLSHTWFEDDPLYFKSDGREIVINLNDFKTKVENSFTVVMIKHQSEYDRLNLPELDSAYIYNTLRMGGKKHYIGYNTDYIYLSYNTLPANTVALFDRHTGKAVTGLQANEYTEEVPGYIKGSTCPQHIITKDGHLFVVYKKYYNLYRLYVNSWGNPKWKHRMERR